MARRKPTTRIETVLFDVVYVDGTQSSNRRVSSALLGGLEGDDAALGEIQRQDREISERSGKPRPDIKSVTRVKKKKVKKVA